jgi:hypothetical protein
MCRMLYKVCRLRSDMENTGATTASSKLATLCAVGPSGLGLLGHPIIGAALHWWCNHSG